MTRIVPTHPTRAARLLPRLVMATLVAGTLLLPGSSADAALTTGKCLAQKSKAWGNLRKCQATARAKILEGKVGDLTKCQTAFQGALTKIGAKATKAAIACRYGANGDGTVTDYDTGLQWELKDGEVGGVCLIFVDRPNHCVNATYTWADAQIFVNSLNGSSTDSFIFENAFAGYRDWRLPTIVELRTIADTTVPGCSGGSPCIDPIFGPTIYFGYWSATTSTLFPLTALHMVFSVGAASSFDKNSSLSVRAVRTGL